MRKLVLILAAAAAVGFTLPVISAQAEEGKVVIKTGDRGHHRHLHRGSKKVVIIKERRHDGWRRHHARGSKKIIVRHD